MTTVFDISMPLGAGAIEYPDDPPFRRESVTTLGEGPFSLSKLTMSAHSGTHIDFPSHVIPGGKSAADFPAAAFILPVVVVRVPEDAHAITHEDVLRARLEPGDAILFRTERPVALTPEAARACVGAEARLAGIDTMSVDWFEDPDLPVHRILLGNDVLVLEGIDLSNVPPGRYTLSCLPLLIPGCEASPVRAVLMG